MIFKIIDKLVEHRMDRFKGWLLNLDAISLTEIESIFMNIGLSMTFASTFIGSPVIQSAFAKGLGVLLPLPVCVSVFAVLATMQMIARRSDNATLRWASCVANGAVWAAFCILYLGVSALMWQSGLGAVVVIGHFVFGINAITSVLCGCHIAASVSEKRKRVIKLERLKEWMTKEGVE